MPPDLALLSTLIGSNFPCLDLIFMVPNCSLAAYCLQIYLFSSLAVKELKPEDLLIKHCQLLKVTECLSAASKTEENLATVCMFSS